MELPSRCARAHSSNIGELLSYHGDESPGERYPWGNASLLCQWDFVTNKWAEQRDGARLCAWSNPLRWPPSGGALGWPGKLWVSADGQRRSRMVAETLGTCWGAGVLAGSWV